MGVSTTLFIGAKKEKMFDLMPKLIEDLNKWQRDQLDTYWKSKGFESRLEFQFRDKTIGANINLKDFSNGISSIYTHDFRSFNIVFTINDETRSLFITHNCSNDYSEIYEGDKIIFSLGHGGNYEEVMSTIAESIKEFGNIYYRDNDFDGEFVKLY